MVVFSPTQGWLPRLALLGPIWRVWPCLALFGPVWPRLALFGPVELATFGSVWPCRISHYERKGLEGMPKDVYFFWIEFWQSLVWFWQVLHVQVWFCFV